MFKILYTVHNNMMLSCYIINHLHERFITVSNIISNICLMKSLKK